MAVAQGLDVLKGHMVPIDVRRSASQRVQEIAGEGRVRSGNDQPSAGCHMAGEICQCQARIVQMFDHIRQHDQAEGLAQVDVFAVPDDDVEAECTSGGDLIRVDIEPNNPPPCLRSRRRDRVSGWIGPRDQAERCPRSAWFSVPFQPVVSRPPRSRPNGFLVCRFSTLLRPFLRRIHPGCAR